MKSQFHIAARKSFSRKLHKSTNNIQAFGIGLFKKIILEFKEENSPKSLE
jgi:hypothetical protein